MPCLLALSIATLLFPTPDSGAATLRRHFEPVTQASAVLAQRPAAVTSRAAGRTPAPGPIGWVADVLLHTPPGAVHVGFHESGSPMALPITAGDGHSVLPTRGRGTHPGSAVDIAMPAGVPVTSTVTGIVTVAQPYALYGTTGDLMVTVVPEARPDIEVRHLHLDGLAVQPGERVEAGHTIIAATARQLPFRSQIDHVAGHGPHVHVEAYLTR